MNKTIINNEILAEAAYQGCAKVFTEYAIEKGIDFIKGTCGLLLKHDDSLAYEEWRVVLGDLSATVYASSEKGMHNALAKILEGLNVTDGKLYADFTVTSETPDMPYRGLMVDLARQKHGVEYILRYIDLCYKHRATHLQLHFTDNESFTLPMKAFPLLSTEGSTYTYEEIDLICSYAKARGIKLVPEVDMPGHTRQFCGKYPELFGTLEILPAEQKVFDALKTIFEEVAAMFPDSEWIHIGGDEADVDKWVQCEKTQEYMKQHHITDVHEMYAEYISIVTDMIFELGKTPVVWEGFGKEYNDKISKDVIVICWESYYQPAYDLAEAGFKLINCSWKPLYIVTGFKFWSPEEIMAWNPWKWDNWWEKSVAYPDGYTIDKNATTVLGGQICVWGDYLRDYEDLKQGLEEEFTLIEERLPALCKRLIKLD